MLPEVWVLLEAELAGVFEDEDAVVGEHLAVEDEVGQRGQSLEGVGRVGKDNVEAAVGAFEEVEDVGAHHVDVAHSHAGGFGLDVVGALGIDVD